VHQTTQAALPEPLVVEVKKEAPPVKIASYHHSHHPKRQQSFRKECGHQQSYGPRWKHTGHQQGSKWQTQSKTWQHRGTTWHRKTTTWNKHQAPGAKASVRPCVHISLGWVDARAWSKLTTIMSICYYLSSSYVSRMKHA
jgi:hypothetical protein